MFPSRRPPKYVPRSFLPPCPVMWCAEMRNRNEHENNTIKLCPGRRRRRRHWPPFIYLHRKSFNGSFYYMHRIIINFIGKDIGCGVCLHGGKSHSWSLGPFGHHHSPTPPPSIDWFLLHSNVFKFIFIFKRGLSPNQGRRVAERSTIPGQLVYSTFHYTSNCVPASH